MSEIIKFSQDYADYLKDESRTSGYADSISFPRNESEVRGILKSLAKTKTPITIQGGRTGLAAAAVPFGGHVLNTSRMNRILGLRRNGNGRFFVKVEPGVILSQLRKTIEEKRFDTTGWSDEATRAARLFAKSPEQFFATDPTETSACIGGITACCASGARSYKYKSARKHISALRLILWDGSAVNFRRGEVFADGHDLLLTKEEGSQLRVPLPTYEMPRTKNASGYFAARGMDAIDLIIGSDGTLGVLTEIELELLPLPAAIWGVSSFFESEGAALKFVIGARERGRHIAAVEYFDEGSLGVLREQKKACASFAQLPDVESDALCCVYVELHCDSEEGALKDLYEIGALLEESGGSEEKTWVARNPRDLEQLHFFRHAVPESTNMFIDNRKKTDPDITKLGADMSVPDEHLEELFALYRSGLAEHGLESAIWGHVGDNHVHVNILFRNSDEFASGKALYAKWARAITDMGGAISAEHGVGKIKAPLLEVMYGRGHIAEMARTKKAFDPHFIFGRGNLFAPEAIDEESAS